MASKPSLENIPLQEKDLLEEEDDYGVEGEEDDSFDPDDDEDDEDNYEDGEGETKPASMTALLLGKDGLTQVDAEDDDDDDDDYHLQEDADEPAAASVAGSKRSVDELDEDEDEEDEEAETEGKNTTKKAKV